MAAATGVNIGAISDPQQRSCQNTTTTLTVATQGSQQLRDGIDQTPPTFLVTQSLVSLLTEKSAYCYSPERAEHEATGERENLMRCVLCKHCVYHDIYSSPPLCVCFT